MNISIPKLYELLTVKVGKETAETLTTFIEQKIDKDMENKSKTLATKEDVGSLKETLAKLDTKISDSKIDTIKWSIALWISAIATFIALFVKK